MIRRVWNTLGAFLFLALYHSGHLRRDTLRWLWRASK